MDVTSARRYDDSTAPSGGALVARIEGIAGAGAALAYLSSGLVDRADRYDTRTCADAPDWLALTLFSGPGEWLALGPPEAPPTGVVSGISRCL